MNRLIRVLLSCVLLLVVSNMTASCSSGVDCKSPQNALSAECQVIGALIDCSDAPAFPAEVIKAVEDAVGKGDWAAVETLAIKYGGCVVAQVVSHYDSAEPKAQFAAIRNRVWPGKKFALKGGGSL